MKRHINYPLILLAFALLLLPGPLGVRPSPAKGMRAVPADAALNVGGALRTGLPVKAVFDLKGYELPAGSYASINVRFLQRPEGEEPKVMPGYPETTMVFHVPGLYRMTVILTEISKPSCGGVNARPLLEKSIELRISE